MEPATRRPPAPRRTGRSWWRRFLLGSHPPTATEPGDRPVADLARLAADLRRLERDAETLLIDEQIVARGRRLQAVVIAYDLVLLDAARALDILPPPRGAPLSSGTRVVLRAELAAAGLEW